jgi:hypothetical protein
MKKFNLLALALAIGTMSLFATTTTNEVPDIPVKVIATQIASLFTTPDFAIEEDLSVNILFTFDSEGKIVVLRIHSKDKDVINYVYETLNHKTIETPGEMNRAFKLPLKIKRQ